MLLRIGERADHGFDEPLGLLSDCHRRIEHFLHTLAVIARDPAGNPLAEPHRRQAEAALAYFANAAPRHTADEEQSLFPRLREHAAAASALTLVERLEADHADADEHHRLVDTLFRRWLDDGRLPQHDADELRARLDALQGIYASHIAVEDRELFPLAARVLSDREIAVIGIEMAARRTAGR